MWRESCSDSETVDLQGQLMIPTIKQLRNISLGSLVAGFFLASPLAFSQVSAIGSSETVSWDCIGENCPWGSQLFGEALVWPAEAQALSSRLGYATSKPIYLSADQANGAIIWVDSGFASVYVGTPDASSHRKIADITAGDSFVVTGLIPGEVVSVQAGNGFTFQIDLVPPAGPEVPGPSTTDTSAEFVTWQCTGLDCPWGESVAGYAAVWPGEGNAGTARLGYTSSGAAYLPDGFANGAVITVTSGEASLYVGGPFDGSHRAVATLLTGDSVTVSGLATGEVLSVQDDQPFSYTVTLGDPASNGGNTTVPSGTDPDPNPDPAASAAAIHTTWTCTGTDCPWGSPLTGFAAEWPVSSSAGMARLGYTASAGIYLPDGYANGATVSMRSGIASIWAGHPSDAAHRLIATVGAGDSITVSGLELGDVLSIQSGEPFTMTYSLGDPATNGGSTTVPTDLDPDPDPIPDPAVGTPLNAVNVNWSCTAGNCPWGSPLSGFATVWPTDRNPGASRLGYTTSGGVYLPDGYANDAVITVTSGFASLYAGNPNDASHRLIASLYAGENFVVSGLALGEVLSIQDANAFNVAVIFGDPAINGGRTTIPTGLDPEPDPTPDPTPNPGSGVVHHSVESNWRCNIAECDSPDWLASVIDFPPWSAYSSNNRTDNNSRTTYADDGRLLYPYMGAWADGCQVSVLSGTVLIVEWERGTDVWRETILYPGQSHTINLIGSEDGALIETLNGRGLEFSVSLSNCEPQPLVE